MQRRRLDADLHRGSARHFGHASKIANDAEAALRSWWRLIVADPYVARGLRRHAPESGLIPRWLDEIFRNAAVVTNFRHVHVRPAFVDYPCHVYLALAQPAQLTNLIESHARRSPFDLFTHFLRACVTVDHPQL